jgi:hypothetical protein
VLFSWTFSNNPLLFVFLPFIRAERGSNFNFCGYALLRREIYGFI